MNEAIKKGTTLAGSDFVTNLSVVANNVKQFHKNLKAQFEVMDDTRVCPNCNSDDVVERSSSSEELDDIFPYLYCLDCGESWD